MTKNSPKICLFHTEFFYFGGAEKLIFNQIDYLEKRGFQVTCFAAVVNRKSYFQDRLKNFDIRQILPEFLNKIITHDLLILLSTLFFPFLIFKFKNFDVYLGENQAGPWWAFAASWFYRKPFMTYQNYPTTFSYPRKIDWGAKRNTFLVNVLIRLFKPILIKIDRMVIRQAKAALVNGEYAKLVCEKAYDRKFINCPAGCEGLPFNREIFERRFLGELTVSRSKIAKPYILITNRHMPAKRFDFGIRTIAKLRANLVITGAFTEYTNWLEQIIKKLKISQKVISTGFVSEQELKVLYQNAAVYLYTAPEEDFGLGILEAQGAGVPVVAWNNAGPAFIVKDKVTGLLAKPFNLNNLTTKVDELLKDKELNFKIAKASYLASRKFPWRNHGKILEKNLTKILD